MKSTQQIIDRIDRVMKYALESPRSYALNEQELESYFFHLDDLREYALSDGEDNDCMRSRYSDYLIEHGFQSATFMTRKIIDNPFRLRDDAKDFQEFTNFWQGFLAWRDSP
jgi:hypothetical protein